MIQNKKTLLALFLLIPVMSLIRPAFAAYGTIDKVVVMAPSSADVGQTVLVQATVYTSSSG